MIPEVNDARDIFILKDITIFQDPHVFKVGTDAVLLGAWVSQVVDNPTTILDAGTGCGILALMMASQFSNAMIQAIDIDNHAIQLAGQNVKQSKWAGRVEVFYQDVLKSPFEKDVRFDLIVCNPPFFFHQLTSPNETHTRSKHSKESVQDWMRGLTSRLSQSGRLCIIIPSEDSGAWIGAANENGFYNLDRKDVYSFSTDALPKRSLLCFTKALHSPRITRMVIYESGGQFTPEFIALTGIRFKTLSHS